MNDLERVLISVSGPGARAYAWFKAAVYAALVWNTGVFLLTGTLTEALDAAAWLVLLTLFELETGFGDRVRGSAATHLIHGARFAAAAAIVAAAIGYFHQREWLDAANSALWIAVVALLEFQVRHARVVAAKRAAFAVLAAALYSGLGAMVLAWFWQGEWFAGYDAALWLIAFVTIEINVLRISPPAAVERR